MAGLNSIDSPSTLVILAGNESKIISKCITKIAEKQDITLQFVDRLPTDEFNLRKRRII
jgi:hypothetical protein